MGSNLIHLAHYQGPHGHKVLLLLRKEEERFRWYQQGGNGEQPLGLEGATAEEAILKASERFRNEGFRPVECGIRFSAVERDEHGMNALYCQMVASYSSGHIDGVYFDEQVGHDCYVQQASEEALQLWKELEKNQRRRKSKELKQTR